MKNSNNNTFMISDGHDNFSTEMGVKYQTEIRSPDRMRSPRPVNALMSVDFIDCDTLIRRILTLSSVFKAITSDVSNQIWNYICDTFHYHEFGAYSAPDAIHVI